MREFIFLTLANSCPRFKIFDKIKYRIYKLAGLIIKGPCIIYGPLTIRPIGKAGNIEIGEGTFINTEVRFGCPIDKIKIGKNCLIGPRVCFETMNHNIVFKPNEGRGGWSKSIVIEDEVWIGCGAIILQGVTIGRGSVIAAGAVVNQDVPPKTVYGGVPARLIRNIEELNATSNTTI